LKKHLPRDLILGCQEWIRIGESDEILFGAIFPTIYRRWVSE
jgi:hypothetical protein